MTGIESLYEIHVIFQMHFLCLIHSENDIYKLTDLNWKILNNQIWIWINSIRPGKNKDKPTDARGVLMI